jgi:Glycosyltransferase
MFSRTAKFYSPHGFGFLRLDVPAIARRLLLLAEVMLGRVGSLILTSPSEIELARHRLHAPRIGYVQSGVPRASIPPARTRQSNSRPRVIMVGRVAYQKAPWTFASIARQLADRAEFVWVGAYGESEYLKWVGDAPVRMEPWVTPEDLDKMLDDSDILLFPTLWEGQSLSLIKALSRGLPAVTTDVVGNRDAVVDEVTGFVCDGENQLLERVRLLLDDPDLRARMGAAAREHASQFQVDDALGADLLSEYRRLQ